MTTALGNPSAIREFTERFGVPPEVVASAPGRINWIGEHVDYNDGLVLPMAIAQRVTVAAGRCPGTEIHLHSTAEREPARVDPAAPLVPSTPAWANYARGVIAGLLRRGVRLSGLRILVSSDLPAGAGLSSSAALSVAIATALESLGGGGRLAPGTMAMLCCTAEREFAGVPCGVMDQIVSVIGRQGHALLLDCRNLAVEWIPVPAGASLFVFDTTIRHNLAAGEYRDRRDACLAATRMLGLSSLRDLPAKWLNRACETLPDTLFHRVRHVVTEIGRTREAAQCLRRGDWQALGTLLLQSHASLQNDYEVSCPELDAVIAIASRHPAVFGCRMTGGGFGGSAILLLHPDDSTGTVEHIRSEWQTQTGICPRILPVAPSDGARVERKS